VWQAQHAVKGRALDRALGRPPQLASVPERRKQVEFTNAKAEPIVCPCAAIATTEVVTTIGAAALTGDIAYYVIGLAEGEMPSWQSCKKGDASPEMEEERRNCFVAITRTQERLKLSAAKNYRGWNKTESRFLAEMLPQQTDGSG
jgi:UvrD-like helicase family protein